MRGPAPRHGTTAGPGHARRGTLAGSTPPPRYEGGRSPIIRRVPKRGFNNRHGRIVKSINVADLESAFESGATITPELLRSSGVAKGIWHELKVLGNGNLSKKLSVSAHRFSKQAREKIIAAGGSVNEVPGPAALVKGQKKARDAKQSTSP